MAKKMKKTGGEGMSVDDKFWDKGFTKNKSEFEGSAASGKKLPAPKSGDLKPKEEFPGSSG